MVRFLRFMKWYYEGTRIPDAIPAQLNEAKEILETTGDFDKLREYLATQKWGVIGLVHDLDYEQFPEEHCHKSEEILKKEGWPAEYIRAVVSHGWGICSDAEPQTDLEKALYAVDELTGLVVASVLVRPSKSVMDLTAKSVKKKWKDKRFAAGVDRSIIEKGAGMLGMELGELITDTIMGMREIAEEIGLKGDND